MRIAAVILAILILLLAKTAFGLLDGDTDGQIINRLEKALTQLEPRDSARLKISMRLADLHSERARVTDLNTIANQTGSKSPVPACKTCVSANRDRDRALELYSWSFDRSGPADQSRILEQMGHLYQLQGLHKKAEDFFNSILRSKRYSHKLKAQAHAGLGNLNYQKTEFKKALKHYELALEEKNLPRRTQVIYRMAWSLLNLDRLSAALQHLENLLEGPLPDATFRQEVSRDYATFLARGEVRSFQITRLLDLSPPESRTENIYQLANELDRLGKKRESLMAWQVANTLQNDPNEKLEGHVKVAWVQYDLGNTLAVQNEIKSAIDIWKSNGCKKKLNCEDLQFRIKKLLTEWDRGTQKAPPPELLESYLSYLTLFDRDTRVTYSAAHLAGRLGQSAKAASLYSRSGQLSKEDLKKARGEEERKALKTIFEGSLMSGIESAEKSKDKSLRAAAYDNYIRENPRGEKAADVRYQIAHLQYEKENYKTASTLFRSLARDNGVPMKIRKLSADLALDCLNILKNQDDIEKWAIEFANAIPDRRKEYYDIARKAVMNTVATRVNNPKASDQDLRFGLKKMNLLPTAAMDEKSKIKLLVDRITLARRLRDLNQVQMTTEELLAITDLPRETKRFALKNQLWVADMTLDFSNAYKLTQTIAEETGPDPKTELSLAVYADLAGLNPTKHYQKYLESLNNPSEERNVIANLVRHSKDSSAALLRYESQLKTDPKLFASLAVEDFNSNASCSKARNRFDSRAMKELAEANAVLRICALRDLANGSQKLVSHHFDTKSDAAVKRSVNQRIALLKLQEEKSRSAIESGDWTLQLAHLSLLAREYRRFYTDLLALPLPRLGREDKERYKTLLFTQAEPYDQAASKYASKTNELWNREDLRSSILKDYANSSGPFRKLLSQEVHTLHDIAPKPFRPEFTAALQAQEEIVDPTRVNRAIAQVKQDPFNEKSLRVLKELKEKTGDTSMANYLNARLSKKGEL
jgi:hypothetical protein